MEFKGALPVTQVIVGTSRLRAGRFLLPLIGGIVALGLVGCSSQTASVDVDPALAQPQVQATKPIAFAPVVGVPPSNKNASKLSEALALNAGQKHIPVVAQKEAEYMIRGFASAKVNPKGAVFACKWEIWDRGGKLIKRFEVSDPIEGKKGGDAWAQVDEAAMQRMASKATDELLTWLPKEGAPGVASSAGSVQSTSVTSQPATTNNASTTSLPAATRSPKSTAAVTGGPVLAAQTETARSGPAVVVVMPVTGAPGDGVTSLTNAMKQSLQQHGVALADPGSGGNAYIVRGSVELDKAANGQQPIIIKWAVYGPNGQQLPKGVVQRNNVQEGSLDGAWGQTADLAAGEAAKTVAKMIPKPTG